MRLTPESAEQIARKTSQDPAKTTAILEDMVEKGLISAVEEGEQRKFCLMPFVLGVFEEQLGRIDEELARLYEEYFPAFMKELLGKSPPLLKVIPVEKSIPVEVQVFPYEQASALLKKAKSFAVGNVSAKSRRHWWASLASIQ